MLGFYSVAQWFLFFYIYCFLGWVWECCYVSVKMKKWVNRGFLHGPFLPIYGSGAIVILVSTIGVRESIPLIYIMGLVSSTILEFCTGYCMEKMFGVKYWDYSNRPFNIGGHICLFVSLGWGCFSVLLIKLINAPIEKCVLWLPTVVSDAVAFALTIYMAVDFTISFNEAMDFKATLIKFTKENEQVRILAKRVEIASAFAGEDMREYRKRVMAGLEDLREHMPHLEEVKEGVKEHMLNVPSLEGVREHVPSLEEVKEGFKEHMLNASPLDEARDYLRRIIDEREELNVGNNREYKSIEKIMRRNPMAISKKYSEAFAEIKDRISEKRK